MWLKAGIWKCEELLIHPNALIHVSVLTFKDYWYQIQKNNCSDGVFLYFELLKPRTGDLDSPYSFLINSIMRSLTQYRQGHLSISFLLLIFSHLLFLNRLL